MRQLRQVTRRRRRLRHGVCPGWPLKCCSSLRTKLSSLLLLLLMLRLVLLLLLRQLKVLLLLRILFLLLQLLLLLRLVVAVVSVRALGWRGRRVVLCASPQTRGSCPEDATANPTTGNLGW